MAGELIGETCQLWHHDQARADRAVRFLSGLRQSKGKFSGQQLALLPWQEREIRTIFGDVDSAGMRRVRTSYWCIPRKNGKTTIAAGCALYLLVADGEQGAEVYMVAGDIDQAAHCFGIAAAMVQQNALLSRRCRIVASTRRIIDESTRSVLRVVSSDARLQHGANVSGCIADEIHVWPDRALWDAMQTGRGTRQQPLTIALSTAGDDDHGLEQELWDYSVMVRDGLVDDPRWHPVLYAAEKAADWEDPTVWASANPSLDVTIGSAYLADEARQAAHVPAMQQAFRRLYLNQRGLKSPDRYIPVQYLDGQPPVSEDELEGRQCYGGLDLSSTSDLTAWAMVFPPVEEGEPVECLVRTFCPADTVSVREKRDRVPYWQWTEAGWIIATPGRAIVTELVGEQIMADCQRYRVVDVAYDRWGSTAIAQQLMAAGVQIAETGQGYQTMSLPTKELLRLVLEQQIRIGTNPVLRWCLDNLVVDIDPAGSVKPNKARCREKIDCAVALIMAIDRMIRHGSAGESDSSVYDDPDYLVRVI